MVHIRWVEGETFASANVDGQSIATLKVSIAGENREISGRRVHANAYDREAAGRNHVVSEEYTCLTVLDIALKFKISETVVEDQIRARDRIAAQGFENQSAIGRDSRYAAIIELNFCFTVVSG